MTLLELTAAALAIGGALYAISAKRLMRGVLGLALFFVGIATFFADLGAWYLAAGQLFLFVGGVVTLFVLAFNAARTPILKAGIGGIIFAALVAVVLAMSLSALTAPVALSAAPPSLAEFGYAFFTGYGWVINIALLLLFSALLSAQYLLEDQ